MSILSVFFIYFVVWWLTLFTVLPWGVERNTDTGKGFDAGAPSNPNLKKKLVINSVIAGVIVGFLWIAGATGMVDWDAWLREIGKSAR